MVERDDLKVCRLRVCGRGVKYYVHLLVLREAAHVYVNEGEG